MIGSKANVQISFADLTHNLDQTLHRPNNQLLQVHQEDEQQYSRSEWNRISNPLEQWNLLKHHFLWNHHRKHQVRQPHPMLDKQIGIFSLYDLINASRFPNRFGHFICGIWRRWGKPLSLGVQEISTDLAVPCNQLERCH
ncbi:hypothetical protein BC351_33245 [Paenibacillus ferrarius]|uniref:Uncharacterized protein n=1 Tax=Paenibacillus ferrarius TaxID=1469647 RepID=A0A1V4HE09_9BACL|nr:hypothetical protein BC351_33245 [Paenibacillus ferrarius]